MLLAELFDVEDAAEAARARATTWLDAHQRAWEHLPAWMPDGDLAATRLAERVAPWFADASRPGLLDRLMAINVAFKGAWHILPKVDSLGAPFDVAPRSPLFDRRVVELAFQVPARLKRFGAIEKHLFKEAIRDLLPAEVVERPKSGMMVPVEAWFNGPLKGWARERILGGLAPRGFLRRDALEDLLEGRRGGLRPRRGVKIWLLLTLEAWVRRVLDRGRDGART
jgi:asparagine synthase (glutamine-hydrolysing)